MNMPLAIGGNHVKITVFTVDGLDPLVLANLQVVMLGGAPIVFERFQSSRLHERTREWDVSNLEQLGRSKKCHVGRIVKDRIDQASLFQDECFESGFLSFDRAGQSGRTGTDDEDVSLLVTLWDGLGAR